MCDGGLTLAAASFAINAGATIANHSAQSRDAKATKEEAVRAMRESWKGITLREEQEQAATAQSVMSIARAARSQRALAALQAGESGVSGASVYALLNDIESQELTAQMTERRNLEMVTEQLQREKESGFATAQSRINSAQSPNPWLSALQIGGSAIDFATTMNSRKP